MPINRKNNITLAIFDLDGTLYDTKSLDVENEIAVTLAISEFLNIGTDEAKELLNEKRKTDVSSGNLASLSSTFQKLGIPEDIIQKHQLQQMNPEAHIKRDDELVRLMRHLHEYIKIALLTNTRGQIASRILSCIGLNKTDFDVFLTGEKLKKAKPSIVDLQRIVDKANMKIENCVVIGDRYHVDIEPGEKIGMSTVLVSGRDEVISWLNEKIKIFSYLSKNDF